MEEIGKLRHTVGFSRKISDGNYGGTEHSIFLQFEMDADADLGSVLSQAEATWDVAVAAVLDRLGVPYEIDPDTGRVSEDKAAATAAILEAAFAEERPRKVGPNAVGVGDRPPFDSYTQDQGEKDANSSWAWARFETHPHEFYDNRADKAAGKGNPKGPDIKHKASGVGAWGKRR